MTDNPPRSHCIQETCFIEPLRDKQPALDPLHTGDIRRSETASPGFPRASVHRRMSHTKKHAVKRASPTFSNYYPRPSILLRKRRENESTTPPFPTRTNGNLSVTAVLGRLPPASFCPLRFVEITNTLRLRLNHGIAFLSAAARPRAAVCPASRRAPRRNW